MTKDSAEIINPVNLIYPRELFPFEPDQYPSDEILQANLKALTETDQELAHKVAATKLPDNYIASITADGCFNYKVVHDNNTSTWLGMRSAPICGAAADRNRLEQDDSNYAINGFGDGYNISETLKDYLPFQALFVLESNIVTIRANLQIHDFSTYILNGQLVIIYSAAPFEKLTDFLQHNYGYQRIHKSLICHHKTEQQNNIFNTKLTLAIEQSMLAIPEISRRISEKVSKSLSGHLNRHNKEQLTISSLPCNNSIPDSRITADLLREFNNLGVKTCHNSSSESPRRTTPYYIMEKLCDQAPDALLLYNSFRNSGNSMPETLPVINILPGISLDAANSLDNNTTRANDIVVCPRECFAAFDKQQQKPRLIEISTTVNCSVFKTVTETDSIYSQAIKDIIIITDRLSVDYEYYNIRLNSYIELLNIACKKIADDPDSYNSGLANFYFDSAIKKATAKLNDKQVKDSLQDVLAAIAEGLVQDIYGTSLLKQGLCLSIIEKSRYVKNDVLLYKSMDEISEKWDSSPLKEHVIARANDSDKLNAVYNSARIAVFTHTNGSVNQDMLNAAAAGLLVMTKANPKDRQPDGLHKIFEPGKEIITYTTCDDLCRKARHYLDNEDKRRAITEQAISKIETQFDLKIVCGKILDVLKQ